MSSHLKNAIGDVQAKIENLNEHKDRIKVLAATNLVQLTTYEKILGSVEGNLDKLQVLQHLIEYLKIVRDVQDISDELRSCVKGNDDHKTVGLYLSLNDGGQSDGNSVLGRLRNVEAEHLKEYTIKVAAYWHDSLKEKFSKTFEATLKEMQWPHLASVGVEPPVISRGSLNKVTTVAEYLFLVCLCKE